jgi:hypothetical protein
LPDVNHGTRDGLSGGDFLDNAVHKSDLTLAVWVLNDGIAKLAEGGVGGPEGAEDGGGSGDFAGLGYDLVRDLVDQAWENVSSNCGARERKGKGLRFQANDVADAMALVTGGGADLADRVDEVDTQHPLLGSELDLAGKVVDVADEGAQDDAGALGGLWPHGVDDIGSEVGIVLGGGGRGRHLGGFKREATKALQQQIQRMARGGQTRK